jgi:phosphatidate cytidylyltransferase
LKSESVPTPMSEDAAPATSGSSSRAGRNVPVAIAVGVVMGAAVLASLYLVPWLFLVLLEGALVIGCWEIITALKTKDIEVAFVPTAIAIIAIGLVAYEWGTQAFALSVGITWLVLVALRLLRGPDGFIRDAGATVLVYTYLGVFGSFAALMLSQTRGADRVMIMVALVVSNDVGGYVTGVFFGRHPIAPTLSPKKSWEGFVGSVILACGIGAWLTVWLMHGQIWQGMLLGFAVAVSATFGDFLESALKRDLGVKDLGKLLPGHGGMMDRLDSELPSALVTYVLLFAFLGA